MGIISNEQTDAVAVELIRVVDNKFQYKIYFPVAVF